jgi:hypothetical protein
VNKITINFIILAALIVYQENSYAWNAEVTHKDLSRYAADVSVLKPCLDNNEQQCDYLKKIGLEHGLKDELTWSSRTKIVKEWLAEGGELEDYATRWRNHFHNPFNKPWLEAGLSDLWSGQSALLWAQSYNESQQPMADDWSWQRTRKLYHLALTSWDPAIRSSFFAETFRGLGQQMHLLQDMAVPAHVRNDAHPLDAIVGNNGSSSFFETWTKNSLKKLEDLQAFAPNPTKPHLIFSTPTDNGVTYTGLAPITQLFDTNQYDGSNPSTSDDRGLAEYTNANFFSDDTINMPNVWVSDGHTFPYPNAGSTNLQDYIVSKALPTTVIAEDGEADLGFWIQKIGDEPIDHFVKPGYTTNHIYDILGGGYVYYTTFVIDDACHHDYAEKLLPRAVGYSAALLDYFFRGTLDVTWPDTIVYSIADGSQTPYTDAHGNRHQQFTMIKAWVGNTSYIKDQAGNIIGVEGIKNGIIQAVARYKVIPNYASDLSNYPPDGNAMKTVQYSYSVSKSETVNDGDIIPEYYTEYTFDFANAPIPAGITDLTLQVVFKGTLGNEADNAIAVGMIDLMEPTHLVFWNLTDRFSYGTICPDNPGYYCYHLYTKDQIDSNAPLKALLTAHGEDYSPKNLTFTFAFKDGEPTGLLPPVAQAVVPPGGHVRLITLIDGQSTYGNYVQYNWQSDYASDYFSGAITQTRPDGTIQATPAPAFRFHQETGVPLPFIQHNDYEIINCYPETTGGCVINESEEPAAEPTSVPVTLMFN